MDLQLRDKWGLLIKLTKKRIKHIGKHMDLHDKIHFIEETLRFPEILSPDEEQEGIWYYQRDLREEDLFFIVVVKRKETEGYIITIFKSKRPKQK